MTTFQLFNSKRDKKILRRVSKGILVITVIVFWIFAIGYIVDIFSYEEEGYYEEEFAEEKCNVVRATLQGSLYTYISNEEVDEEGFPIIDAETSEYIVFAINEAEANPEIKAFVLEIDSYGGTPVAAEEVANALRQAKKPTVALIREYGVSAAYWAASGADKIFASANSDVGGIGVTFSYLENVEQNRKEGLAFQQLAAGKYKDAGDPNKPLTTEERALFERDLKILHENFIKVVAESRNLEIEQVRELADGFSVLGQMALENGLIDRIGGLPEVKEYLAEMIGEEVELCW
jgi:protease-4